MHGVQFTAMLSQGMLRNLLCLYSERCILWTVVTLGTNICGHQGIVHGGNALVAGTCAYCMLADYTACIVQARLVIGSARAGLTAALIDETLGSLVYILKREGRLGEGAALIRCPAAAAAASLSLIELCHLSICESDTWGCARAELHCAPGDRL